MTNINESKIDATDRLRCEGRWEEAQQYRDEVRKKLRADGMKRTEAAEAAWNAMLERYRPLADASEAGAAALPEGEVPAEWANIGTPDLLGDYLWVYSQLGNPHIQPSDAPGPGAWTLLRWARANRDRFFDQFASRAGTLLARAEEERRREEEEAQHDEEAESRLLRFMENWNVEEARRLARDIPEAVRGMVRQRLDWWWHDHGVTVPEEAAGALDLAMHSVVGECVELMRADPDAFRKETLGEAEEEWEEEGIRYGHL